MKHRVKTKKFNRHKDHRKALYFSLIKSVIENSSISTTKEKAKYIRSKVEKLVTKSKKSDSLSTRRYLLSRLQNNKKLTDKLFNELAGKYKERNGGYLRIQNLFKRKGDNAQMVRLSWVETSSKIENKNEDVTKKSKKKLKAKTTKVVKKETKNSK